MLVVLMNSKFDSGDYYMDSQFDDFYYSMSTMSIFMLGGNNYVELVEPSLDISGTYIFIWVGLTIMGNYFMLSLLLQFFGDAYAAKSDQQQKAGSRRNEWSSLTLTFLMLGHAPEDVMNWFDFEQLLLSSSISRCWLGCNFSHKLQSAIASISELQSPNPQEVAALATICCDLNDQHLLQYLMDQCTSSHDLLDCRTARNESLIPAVLVRSGLCTADRKSQIEYVQDVLGPLDEHKAESLLSTSIPIMLDTVTMRNLTQMQEIVAGVVAAALKCQHQMEQCCGEQSEVNDWAHRMVLDVFRLGRTTSSVTPQVLELVSLVAVHKLRIRVMFTTLSGSVATGVTGVSLSKIDW